VLFAARVAEETLVSFFMCSILSAFVLGWLSTISNFLFRPYLFFLLLQANLNTYYPAPDFMLTGRQLFTFELAESLVNPQHHLHLEGH
jgi:hypothetical protein